MRATHDRRRRLRHEPLEDRFLLSGVTLITHGYQLSAGLPAWVESTAREIAGRSDNASVLTMGIADASAPHVEYVRHDSGPVTWSAEHAGGEVVCKIDWSGIAADSRVSSGDVAAVVVDYLINQPLAGHLLAEHPLHLVGHSRGASAVGEMARLFGRQGVWVDHVTTLDPHPVDGVNEPLPLNWGDAPMQSWENVVFWDNYWRTEGGSSFDFTGEPVDNTFDVQLDEPLLATGGYSFEHSDVHLWYYGTIDTSTDPPANNGDRDVPNGWYGGPHPSRTGSGYYFSRPVGGTRASAGLSDYLGGDAQRSQIDFSAAVRPSMVDFRIDAAGLEFTIGEAIPVAYYYHDFDSSATVTFHLDADRNPYNGNELVVDQQPVAQTGSSLPGGSHPVSTAGASPGGYYLSARIGDAAGHAGYVYAADRVTLLPSGPSEVTGRHVFYNGSAFDVGLSSTGPEDDGAVAADKVPLMPGAAASAANYTAYSRGINGLMVDVAGLPGVPTAVDFSCRVGNSEDLTTWTQGPHPTEVTVRPGDGVDGSDRITLVWPDNAIQKQWLEVTVLPTDTTGLAEADVFYFGNAIAETGNSTSDAKVNAIDMLGARDNPRDFLDPAPIDFPYDYDRDARVNAVDMLIARDNQTHFLDALKLITVPGKHLAQGTTAGGSMILEGGSMILEGGRAGRAAGPTRQHGLSTTRAWVRFLDTSCGDSDPESSHPAPRDGYCTRIMRGH